MQENPEEAYKWFKKSADQGHSDAQYNIARMYATGYAVPQDAGQALMWCRKSAALSNMDAQYELGNVLSGFNSPVGKENVSETMKWYLVGNDKDKTERPYLDEAVMCFKMASEQGHSGAHGVLPES